MKALIQDPDGAVAIVPYSHALAYETVRSRLMNAKERKVARKKMDYDHVARCPVCNAVLSELKTPTAEVPGQVAAMLLQQKRAEHAKASPECEKHPHWIRGWNIEPKNVVSVGEDFPIQQARVMDLMIVYGELPKGAGAFAASMMRDCLIRSFKLAIQGDKGDIVALLQIYEELKGFKE